MTNPLFTVQCPTCLSRLRVTRAEAVGAIWPCPKCGGLVHVAPPPGWTTPSVTEGSPDRQADDRSVNPLEDGGTSELLLREARERSEIEEGGAGENGGQSAGGGSAEATVAERAVGRSLEGEKDVSATRGDRLLDTAPGGKDRVDKDGTRPLWRRRRLALVVLALGVGLGLAVIGRLWIGGWSSSGPVTSDVVPQQGRTFQGETVIPAAQSPERLLLAGFPKRLSEVLYIDMRAPGGPEYARLLAEPFGLGLLISWADQIRQALGLKEESLAWAFVAGREARPAVCLFVLRQDQQAEQLNLLGPEVSKLGAYSVREFRVAPWQLAFCVVDRQHVLVGEPEHFHGLLTAQSTPEEGSFGQGAAEQGEGSGRWPAWLLLRLRASSSQPPLSWLDVGSPEIPKRLGLLDERTTLGCGWEVVEDRPSLVVRWYTPDEGTASAVETAVKQFQSDARAWLDSLAADAPGKAWAAFMGVEGPRWQAHVEGLATALRGLEITRRGTWTEVRGSWGSSETAVAAAREFKEAVQTLWKIVAARRWRARQGALGTSLGESLTQKRRFPAAASGGELLPPETRLSWITELLPYLGHQEWYAGLQVGYSWNAPQNREITGRYLPEVVNPLAGPTQSTAGFFDTHIVGITGVGAEAGYFPLSDPRAGLFNFRQPVKKEDVSDGLSNTLALLPVQAKRGPWAAGGYSTARGLTARPYVEGPDGFGSGYPLGMLAVMADGSVRFVRRDVDPRVLEQLATIAGGEAVNTDVLGAPLDRDSPPGLPKGAEPSGPAADAGVSGNSPLWPGERLCTSEGQARATAEKAIEPILETRLVVREWPPMPLGLAIAVLSEWTGIPITVDPESIQWKGISAGSRVRIEPGEKTVRAMLEEIAGQLGFGILKCGEFIILCVPERLQDRVVYRIKDEEMQTRVSAELLESLASSIWGRSAERSGSLVKCHPENDVLVLEGGFIPVLTIRDFLIGRELPLPAQEVPQTAQAQEGRVTLSIYESSPVISIVAAINRSSPLQVLVDWPSLFAEELRPDTPATLSSVDEPVLGVIEKWAQGLNARAYSVDKSTIIIAGSHRFERPTLRAYPLDALRHKGLTPGAIREHLTTKCRPESWAEHGGVGRLFFTADGRVAIIYHTATGHRSVREFLQSGWLTQ